MYVITIYCIQYTFGSLPCGDLLDKKHRLIVTVEELHPSMATSALNSLS